MQKSLKMKHVANQVRVVANKNRIHMNKFKLLLILIVLNLFSMNASAVDIFPLIKQNLVSVEKNFSSIPNERKNELNKLSAYIQISVDKKTPCSINVYLHTQF